MMLGLAGLAALAGCHDLTAPDDGGELVTSASRREIVVTNATAQPVFTLILGRDLAARALIAPCVNEPRCPPLLPGATRAEQYPSASVAASESEAIVGMSITPITRPLLERALAARRPRRLVITPLPPREVRGSGIATAPA